MAKALARRKCALTVINCTYKLNTATRLLRAFGSCFRYCTGAVIWRRYEDNRQYTGGGERQGISRCDGRAEETLARTSNNNSNYTVSQKRIPEIFSYNSSKNCLIFIIFCTYINNISGKQKIVYFPTSPK